MNPSKLNSKFSICALFTCLSLFSLAVPGFAQEKKQFTTKNKTFAYEISKETTAADLAAIEKEINAEKVASLHFSNVKRNKKNEIIGITTQFNDERGSSQKKSEYNSQGISPFAVKIHENAKGDKYLEISSEKISIISNPSTNLSSFSDLFSDEYTNELMDENEMMKIMRSVEEATQQQEELIKKMFEEKEK